MVKSYNISKLTIRNWNEDDQPREKLMNKGKSVLSNAELIAILIGSGNTDATAVELSRLILESVNNNLADLGKLTVNDLMKFKGIGEAKAISIIAALELGRRRKESEMENKTKITSSKDVYNHLFASMNDLPYEEFWILLLNRSNMIIRKERISTGGISGTVVDPRMVFKLAVENLSSGIVLAHNHPSGSQQPSESDKQLTKKLQEAGKVLDIPVLDHIIFTDGGYFSFADEGMI